MNMILAITNSIFTWKGERLGFHPMPAQLFVDDREARKQRRKEYLLSKKYKTIEHRILSSVEASAAHEEIVIDSNCTIASLRSIEDKMHQNSCEFKSHS